MVVNRVRVREHYVVIDDLNSSRLSNDLRGALNVVIGDDVSARQLRLNDCWVCRRQDDQLRRETPFGRTVHGAVGRSADQTETVDAVSGNCGSHIKLDPRSFEHLANGIQVGWRRQGSVIPGQFFLSPRRIRAFVYIGHRIHCAAVSAGIVNKQPQGCPSNLSVNRIDIKFYVAAVPGCIVTQTQINLTAVTSVGPG